MQPKSTSIRVRPVDLADRVHWERLWEGYNVFYGRTGAAALPAEVTSTTWERFFDPSHAIHALVAEVEGNIAGLAHYIFHPSTNRNEGVVDPQTGVMIHPVTLPDFTLGPDFSGLLCGVPGAPLPCTFGVPIPAYPSRSRIF